MKEMFIERRIVKRGNVRIRLTPEEIKEAAKIYANNDNVIVKLNNWIDTIKICRNVLDAMASFRIEFNGEYKKEFYHDNNDKSYDNYKIKYILKDGIDLCIESGNWNKEENEIHKGLDIYLSFKDNFKVSIFEECRLQDFEDDMNILFEKLKSEVKQDE